MKYPHVFIALTLLCLQMLSSSAMSLTLESPAFQSNTFMPIQYTCNGKNVSPPLNWHNIPPNTQSLVLIMDDPDAPHGVWVHWLVFNLPATLNHLAEAAVLPDEALSGWNSWNQHGYGGACSPRGIHRYVFTLYALDARLTVNSSCYKADLLNAMHGHVLATSKLVGLYGKK